MLIIWRRRACLVAVALVATAALVSGLRGAAMTQPANLGNPGAAAGTVPSYDEAMADPERKVGFIKKFVKTSDGQEHAYQVWIPLDYTAKQKWPVILSLHGAGEKGSDGEKVLKGGLPREIARRKGKFEFIVVIPQSDDFWHNGSNFEVALKAVATTGSEYAVDHDRVYLVGYSMGGQGAWELARKQPKSFAACVPIAGATGAAPAAVMALRTVPLWVWHGDTDTVVKPDMDRTLVANLVKANAVELRYTEVPNVGHDAWPKAYASDELWEWLLQHKVSDLGKQKAVKPVIDAPTWDGTAPITPRAAPAPSPPGARGGTGTGRTPKGR